MKNYYVNHKFKITKREVVASITIIALMLLIGVLISSKISEIQMDKNEKYNKALKITDSELFQYGMDTNVGNALVYGELKAIDAVTYNEIGGEYAFVKRVEERYTRHTSHHHTKHGSYTTHHWTWDYVGEESTKSKSFNFCGIDFNGNKINLPKSVYADTISGGYHIRYKYYVCYKEYTGTLFTHLSDGTIKDKSKFYDNKTIKETVNYLESDIGVIIFWIVWLIFICLSVFGFYYLDNKWLDN